MRLGATTSTEIGILLASGAVVAAALIAAPARERLYGALPVAAMLVLTAIAAWSVTWAVNPSDAWIDANRHLAYFAAFAAAVALAHLAGRRWASVLGAITLSAVLISGVRAHDEGAARGAEPGRDLRPAARAVRLLELRRARRRDGPAGPALARRPPDRARRAERARRAGRDAAASRRSCSPTRAARCSPRGSAWRCGSRSCRCGCAASRCSASARPGGAVVAVWTFGQTGLSDDRVDLAAREAAGLRARRRARRRAPRRARPVARDDLLGRRAPAEQGDAARGGRGHPHPARARADRGRGRARAVRPRARRLRLAHVADADGPVGVAAAERPRPPHRGRQRARQVLERVAEGVPRPPVARRRRGWLRDGAAALPPGRDRRAPRPRLRHAGARPTSGSSGWPRRWRCWPRGWRPRSARPACGRATAACRSRPNGSPS